MGTAERLVQFIADAGGNQTALAKRMGQTLKWLNNRALGVTPIKADELPLLAAALGKRIHDFYEETPTARPPAGQEPPLADVFAREMSHILQHEGITDAERELLSTTLETTHQAIHRYRARLLEEELQPGRENNRSGRD